MVGRGGVGKNDKKSSRDSASMRSGEGKVQERCSVGRETVAKRRPSDEEKKPEVHGVLLACIFVYDNNKRNWERREEDKSNVALVRLARKAGVQKGKIFERRLPNARRK